jgi:Spy/CpxP family protein refolding chaperone
MKPKLAAVAMIVLISASLAFAQPARNGQPGQRGGGMRGMGGGIDQEWAALCFEINLTADQITKLRPTFQWAWKARNSAIQSAMASHSMDAARKTMESTTKTLDERVNIVLTKTQKAQWAKYKANQAAMRDKWRKSAGGGRGK